MILRSDPNDLGYGDPRGSETLRRQIARHLGASRGIDCDADCVVVVPGTHQGLRMCAEALLKPGDVILFEEPGYVAARKTFEAAHLSISPAPVDAEGLDLELALAKEPNPKAVYVTPSHQFPTAVTISMPRRASLIRWARDTGAWIFEDDYDSEFRYSGSPLTALAGIGDRNRVIYIGTFSRPCFPECASPIWFCRRRQLCLYSPFGQLWIAFLQASSQAPSPTSYRKVCWPRIRDGSGLAPNGPAMSSSRRWRGRPGARFVWSRRRRACISLRIWTSVCQRARERAFANKRACRLCYCQRRDGPRAALRGSCSASPDTLKEN